MTGEEQVYALFVQANPVPDPAVLPLELEASAPLLYPVEERDGKMLTEERSRTEAPKQKRSWSRPLTAATVAFVLVVAVGGVAWWFAGEANPVAAADADTVVMFDGQVVVYDGPESVVSGNVEFTFLNELDEAAELAQWRFDDRAALDAEVARLALGGEMALEPESPLPADATIGLLMSVPAGGEDVSDFFMPAGWYLMDVVSKDVATSGDSYNDYVWRADVIVEVVP